MAELAWMYACAEGSGLAAALAGRLSELMREARGWREQP